MNHLCIAYLGKHTSLLLPPQVSVGGFARRQVVGNWSTRAARFEDTREGVCDFTRGGVVSGMPACFSMVAVEGASADGFENSPFIVGRVCLVGFSRNRLHNR